MKDQRDHTKTSATVRTSASVMGYMCRFFCTCVRDTDVMNPSNQGQNQPQTPNPERPAPSQRTHSL